MQPDLAHQPIHQKRRARHVAGVLQQADEQEQQQDLRQKHDHRAHPAMTPPTSRSTKIARRQEVAAIPHPGDARLEPAHGQFGEREDPLEDQEHQADEDEHAPHPVGERGRAGR